MNTRILAVLYLMTTSLTISDSVLSQGSGQSGIRNIDHLYQEAGGKLAIFPVDVEWDNPALCGSASRVVLMPDHARRDEYYAAILAALMSGREVKFWLGSDCVSWNGTSYPRVSGVHSY